MPLRVFEKFCNCRHGRVGRRTNLSQCLRRRCERATPNLRAALKLTARRLSPRVRIAPMPAPPSRVHRPLDRGAVSLAVGRLCSHQRQIADGIRGGRTHFGIGILGLCNPLAEQIAHPGWRFVGLPANNQARNRIAARTANTNKRVFIRQVSNSDKEGRRPGTPVILADAGKRSKVQALQRDCIIPQGWRELVRVAQPPAGVEARPYPRPQRGPSH